MTTLLEHLPIDTQPEVDVEALEQAELLGESVHEASLAVQQDPRCAEKVKNLEQQCLEAARLLLVAPEVAPEVVPPLGEAVQTLYRADNVGPKVDLRVTETLGEVAACIPESNQNHDTFVKIAVTKATAFFDQQHTDDNPVGEILDEKLLQAYEHAIHATDSNHTFQEAFEEKAREAFADVEEELVDTSEVAEYHRDRLLQKTDRLSNYAQNGRDVNVESTGVVIMSDHTGPIETIELAPSSDDITKYNQWRRNLAHKIPMSLARQAMLDDEYERLATTDDVTAIRAQLADYYPA